MDQLRATQANPAGVDCAGLRGLAAGVLGQSAFKKLRHGAQGRSIVLLLHEPSRGSGGALCGDDAGHVSRHVLQLVRVPVLQGR